MTRSQRYQTEGDHGKIQATDLRKQYCEALAVDGLTDEPTNGLDSEGIMWVRNLLKHLAGQGRIVLASSHLMSEMALTADHLIVIGRGRLIADVSVAEFTQGHHRYRCASPHSNPARLAKLLAGPTTIITRGEPGCLDFVGLASDKIGDIASANSISIHELIPQRASLEEAFMEMTRDSVEYRSTAETSAA